MSERGESYDESTPEAAEPTITLPVADVEALLDAVPDRLENLRRKLKNRLVVYGTTILTPLESEQLRQAAQEAKQFLLAFHRTRAALARRIDAR